MAKYLHNCKVMVKRRIVISKRNPDIFFASIVTPVLMMLLFVYVLGGAINIGDVSYVNFIVPGIILQCIGQCASTTAIGISSDIENGIIERFRTMPIFQNAILVGHVIESVIKNIFTAFVVFLIAFLIGFRPEAGIKEWIAVIGILILYSLVISWISIVFGMIANGPEGAGAFTIFTIVLPYLSSGFVPTETMPKFLRGFAEHQPMTPIIGTIRSLLVNGEAGGDWLLAIGWCLGLLILFFILAIKIFRNK